MGRQHWGQSMPILVLTCDSETIVPASAATGLSDVERREFGVLAAIGAAPSETWKVVLVYEPGGRGASALREDLRLDAGDRELDAIAMPVGDHESWEGLRQILHDDLSATALVSPMGGSQGLKAAVIGLAEELGLAVLMDPNTAQIMAGDAEVRPALTDYEPYGLPESAVIARAHMDEHVRRWIEAELWIGDRLPQMVDHGISHSRKVDENAMALLLMASRQHVNVRYTDTMFEALSAAAWLHDIGHCGALLGDRMVRDYRHVRKVHGLLSQQLLRDRSEEILPSCDPTQRERIGWLCAVHQRYTVLEDTVDGTAEYKDCHPGTACWVRTEVANRLQDSFEDAMSDLDVGENVEPWVELAAILRVADAADIGVHRMGGRHHVAAAGWQRLWQRHAAEELLERIEDKAGRDVGAAQLLRDYLRNPTAEPPSDLGHEVQALAIEARLFDEFAGYLAFLRAQQAHRDLHSAFRQSRVEVDDEGRFAVKLEIDPERQRDLDDVAEQAAEYIWTEYLPIEALIGRAGLSLRSVEVEQGDGTQAGVFTRDTLPAGRRQADSYA